MWNLFLHVISSLRGHSMISCCLPEDSNSTSQWILNNYVLWNFTQHNFGQFCGIMLLQLEKFFQTRCKNRVRWSEDRQKIHEFFHANILKNFCVKVHVVQDQTPNILTPSEFLTHTNRYFESFSAFAEEAWVPM